MDILKYWNTGTLGDGDWVTAYFYVDDWKTGRLGY